MPAPPKNAVTAKSTRNNTGSTPKYSPRPPATPAATRLSLRRSSRGPADGGVGPAGGGVGPEGGGGGGSDGGGSVGESGGGGGGVSDVEVIPKRMGQRPASGHQAGP